MEDNWISVKEKLPEIEESDGFFSSQSKEVLITDGKEVYMGFYRLYEDDEFPMQWKLSGSEEWDIDNITHWMYKPKLP